MAGPGPRYLGVISNQIRDRTIEFICKNDQYVTLSNQWCEWLQGSVSVRVLV